MFSLLQKKPRQLNDDNMIPLINIVFLMLIFFLVAGQISSQDSALFTAPQSSQENKLQESDFVILLAADGMIWVDNQAIDGDLFMYLQTRGFTHESRAVLKVDAYLKASILDPVISSLQSLGIQRLKIVTIAPN